MNWRDAPADWRHDGIAMWLLPHAPRQRGEPQARESLAHTLGFAPETLPITRDAQGRPHFIAPLHHLETGWSHSGEALLLALGEDIELVDGGYCANNPTLYAIADAVQALRSDRKDIRLVSVGVGIYPDPKPSLLMRLAKKYLVSVQLLQKTLEINTQSMDQLRQVLFHDIPTIRINDSYVTPEMATDLLEHDLKKLGILFQRGRESFASRETQLREYLI